MSIERLVEMANDIGHFFASEPDRADAIAGIAGHMQRFWDPRMLRHIVTHLKNGGDGLEELPRAAVGRLKAPDASPDVSPDASPDARLDASQ